jgi:hypothetical protein
MGALMAAFSFWMFYRSFSRLQQKQQELADKENEAEGEEDAAAELPEPEDKKTE